MTACPPRVAFVSSYAALGGAELYLTRLLEQRDKLSIERVVCLQEGPFVERLRLLGYDPDVLHTSARARSLAASAWRLRRILARTRPDVVHANGLKGALVALAALSGTRVPVVWAKHDFSGNRRLTRLAAGRCACVIAVSAAVTEAFDAKTLRKVRVIHNGIPRAEVDRGAARRLVLAALGEPTPRAVVALVGRLDPFKGHRELIAVAPELCRRVPGLRLMIIGGVNLAHPDFAQTLRTEVSDRGLEDDIRFLGHRDDAAMLIAGSDVLTISSDAVGLGREGFPYVGLEAMAAGTPVVAYAGGGLSELLGDCGLLVPAGDRAALTDAIVRVVEDADLAARLGRCGRERVAKHFSLEGMVAQTIDVYRAAAG
jgi:glycosyltransferase involved in cell wall biosynthesis